MDPTLVQSLVYLLLVWLWSVSVYSQFVDASVTMILSFGLCFLTGRYKYFDQYLIQMDVRRESLNTNINSAFVIFVVTLLSNAAFAIPVDELADRISVGLTAFLTVCFHWILRIKSHSSH